MEVTEEHERRARMSWRRGEKRSRKMILTRATERRGPAPWYLPLSRDAEDRFEVVTDSGVESPSTEISR